MSYRERVEKRLQKHERDYETERLMREKRSEEYEVLEEVFDRSTLMVVYDLLNKGVIDEIFGVVKAGKESRVYWGKDREKNELAIKIYLTISAEFKKGRLKYIEGDPRFKTVKHDTRSLVFAWAQKEFRNLEQALSARIKVPRPVTVKKNVLVMQFIGKNGKSAPLLKESPPKNPMRMYETLIGYLEKLYRKAELVHGDFSEYNIMIWRNRPVLFDLSQAVPPSHPLASDLLKRDLTNLHRYFRRLGLDIMSVDESLAKVVGQ